MALPYRTVKDLYDTLADAGVVTKSLPDWSSEMNALSESDLYSAGLHDNLIKRGSVGIDRLLEATGLPTFTGQFGRSVGGLVGNPEAGEQIGRSLPRTAVNFAPMFLGGPLGLVGTAALSGADTYTQTGSPAAGLLSGAINAAMPGVANLAEQAILKRVGGQLLSGPITSMVAGKPVISELNRYLPRTLGQGVGAELGGQVAAALFGEAGGFAQEALQGQPLHNPFSTETLLNLTLGQAPFAGIYLTKGGRAKFGGDATRQLIDQYSANIARTRETLAAQEAARQAQEADPLSSIPVLGEPQIPPSPTEVAKNSFLLGKIRREKVELAKEATPESMAEYNKRSAEEQKIVDAQRGLTAGKETVGGETLDEGAGRFDVAGEVHFEKTNTGFRIIRAADTPENRALGIEPGELIGYSTRFEPTPKDGVYSVPARFHTRNMVDNQRDQLAEAQAKWDAENPTIPFNPTEFKLDEFRAGQARLAELQAKLEGVTNEEQLRQTMVDFNNARLELGFPPLDDADYTRYQELMKTKSVDATVRAQLAALQRRMDRKEKRVREEQEQADALMTEILAPREEALRTGELLQPEGVELANEIVALRDSAEFGAKLLPSRFNRLVLKWNREGRPGGLEGLRDQLKEAKRTGRGRRKEPSVSGKVTDAVATGKVAEVAPIMSKRVEIADAVVYKAVNENPALEADAAQWVDWVEGGTKELPKHLQGKDHVEDWNDALRQYTEALNQRNSISKSLDQRSTTPKLIGAGDDAKQDAQEGRFTLTEPSRALDGVTPFVPTEAEAAMVKEWNLEQGGVGLAARLARSTQPEVAALGKALQQFPETLKRVTSEMWNMPGTSFAFLTRDNRAGIVLDASLLQDPAFMEWTVAHELLHGMTKAELLNPSKAGAVEKLTALREEMIGRLNKSDREYFDRAEASGWLDRWNNAKEGEVDALSQELHPDPATRRILYALMNNDELISQGFTSDDARRWLQSQKVTKTQTLWHKFAGWVKELLGIGENAIDRSAFDALMSHTSQVLDQAEYVSSARNYFESYFQNKGLRPERVQEQTRRALGLVLDTNARSPEQLLAQVFTRGGRESGDVKFAARKALAMFQAKDDNTMVATSVLDELGHAPDIVGLDDFAQAVAEGVHGNPEAALELLPTAAADYVFARMNDAKEIIDAVVGATDRANTGLVGLGRPEVLRGPVTDAQKRLSRLVQVEEDHMQAKQDMANLATINPEGWLNRAIGAPSKSIDDIRNMVDPDRPKAGFVTWLERKLALPFQLARQDKRAAELVSRVEQQQANVHNMKSQSLKVFAQDQIGATTEEAERLGVPLAPGQTGGDLSKAALERTMDVVKNPKLTQALNDWIYLNQKTNPGAEVVLPDTHPEVQKLLGTLSPKERAEVHEMLQKTQVSKLSHDAQIVEKMQQIASTAAAKVLGAAARESGLTLDPNSRLALSSSLLEAGLADWNDPQQAAAANAKVAAVGQRLPLEVFNRLLEFTQVESEKIRLIRDNMASRPGWVSGRDYGRFRIVWLDKEQKPHRWSGNDPKEAERVAKAASKVVEFTDRKDASDDEIHYPSMTPELIARIRELEENSWRIMDLSPTEREQARQASIATQIEREAGAQGVPNVQAPGRRLSRGADSIPWFQNHVSWVTSSSHAWTRRLLRSQFESHMSEPEVQASDDYKAWAKDYYEGFVRQDPELATQMRKFTSLWFLGGNMASAIANPIGNGMRLVSELTSLTGKPLNSYTRFLRAAREVAGNFRSNKPWATPEHDQLIKDAIHERKLSPTIYDENAAANEAVSTQYKQIIEGQKPQSWAKRATTLAGDFGNKAMLPFRMGEIWNAQVALLASFDLYREQGFNYQEAKAKAFEFSGAVNDSGGRANRPVAPFSARGAVPRSAAMLATAMQSYVLGSTFQLVRYLKHGLFRPVGLTPHEVYSARAAAVQFLAMQFAAAGLLGLPFVSGALALLDKSFPELELNRKLRERTKEFFESDREGGNVLGDIALTGVPSMFGWDFQSRLSMGNTVPGVSEINGFQPEQLLGPPANLVGQFVKGGQRLVTGQGRLSDWTPPAVKKLVDLMSSGGSSVTDYRGRPVLNDLTPGEKLGIGLGFNPKRLSDFNVASRISENAQKVAAFKESQFRQAMGEEIVAGNFGTVREELRQRAAVDKNFDLASAIRGIAKAAEEQSFPRDLRREGTLGTSAGRSALLSAFRLDTQAPSELNRLQLRTQIEQRLGLRTDNNREMVLATLMDKLRATNPNATRSELRRSAEAATRRISRQTSGLQEQYQ